jgi:sugar lactone lactonase YvrE
MNRSMRVPVTATLAALGLALTLVTPAAASTGTSSSILPTTIALPDGFPPEGIAIGGPFAYLGSRANGSIFRANLITGTGKIVSPATNTPSLGLKIDDRGRLFVSGGNAGDARVVDAHTGQVLAHYQFATPPGTFVNDVVLTPRAAYFTDSSRAVLYKLALGRGGSLPATFETLPLTGDFVLGAGINLNGISRTPDGEALLAVQSNAGLLFRIDPATGVTTKVQIADSLVNGDGLLLIGRTLYVVQNQLNTIAVVRLNRSGTAGEVVDRITDPRFDIPTTVAAFAGRLYLPNARFSTPVTPTTTYTVNAVRP